MKISNFKNNVRKHPKTILVIIGLAIGIIAVTGAVRMVRAAWQEPSAQAPAGNVYAPLTIGPEYQAKKGSLILDPMFSPYGETPATMYPLDVRGSRDVFINTFELANPGNLSVDTDSLVVSGSNHNVGFGTATPSSAVKVDIANGTATAGSATSPITSGSAISINTSGEGLNAAYGSSTADNQSSVSGNSITGPGVYGLNQAGGTGVYAYSSTASALVGKITAPFNPANVAAAVYGEATGIGAWAGYFQQRLGSDDAIVAGKFVPNRLQYSQVPYTAGWEMRTIESGKITEPWRTVYANGYVWSMEWGWETEVHVVNVVDGSYVTSFKPIESATNIYNHGGTSMIFAGGYIWVSGDTGGGTALVTRITPDPASPAVKQYQIGTPNTTLTTMDLVYDDVTAGGPYIWTADRLSTGSYSISRLKTSDGATVTYPALAGAKCLTYDYSWLCSDRLDNDNNGQIDAGRCTFAGATDQASCTALAGANAVWAPGVCSDTAYTDSASCTAAGEKWAPSTCSNSANQGSCTGTWMPADTGCTNTVPGSSPYNPAIDPNQKNNEQLHIRPLGKPSGITLDTATAGGPYLWVSFGQQYVQGMNEIDTHAAGEGVVKMKISDLTQTAYCTGPGRKYSDLTFDSANDRIWLANSISDPNTYGGISKLNPGTGQIENEYVHANNAALWDMNTIRYDNDSSGGPYVWMSSNGAHQNLHRFTIAGASVATISPGGGVYDFAFDRGTAGGPYVWGALADGGGLSRTPINSFTPAATKIFQMKGTPRYDALFDGTYVWLANGGSHSVSRYRPGDGGKVDDTALSFGPYFLIYDGANIWAFRGNNVAKMRATDGVLISEYTTTQWFTGDFDGGITFDGTNVWAAESNKLLKLPLSGCTVGSPGSCPVTSTVISFSPVKLAYDGTSIWASQSNNYISKISTNPVAVQNTYLINEISATTWGWPYNIQDMIYDGTYLWIGTYKNDATGNSIFQIDPANPVDVSTARVVRKMKTFYDPGQCSAGDNVNKTCMTDLDCPGSGSPVCDNLNAPNPSGVFSRTHKLMFDGTYVWAASNRSTDGLKLRECGDGIDNDSDGKIDLQTGNADPQCVDSYDMHESPTGSDIAGQPAECSDHLDNDGNGKCDWDGATGYPGCSGAPDPGCSAANDNSEATRYGNANLTRIIAATGKTVDSTIIGYYCRVFGLVSDGTSVWSASTGCEDGYTLHQIYSGSGRGSIDLNGSVALQQNKAVTSTGQQTGSFAASGVGQFGADLLVLGDVVVSANTWGASTDKAFGVGCDDGQFVAGIDLSASPKITCRKL